MELLSSKSPAAVWESYARPQPTAANPRGRPLWHVNPVLDSQRDDAPQAPPAATFKERLAARSTVAPTVGAMDVACLPGQKEYAAPSMVGAWAKVRSATSARASASRPARAHSSARI